MRLAEAQIQGSILHSELAVRLAAVHYFSHSCTSDASVMARIIEAVGKYGRENSVDLVGEASGGDGLVPTMRETLAEYSYLRTTNLARRQRASGVRREVLRLRRAAGRGDCAPAAAAR